MDYLKSTKEAIFSYFAPKNRYIGIVSIPHSGEIIPAEMRSYLTDNKQYIRRDVDYKVEELVDINELQNAGVAVIVSHIHRTAVDLNRSRDLCLLNWKSNSHGEKLVINEPNETTGTQLIANYYDPYYEMLKALTHELIKVQGNQASFIDLHSMPSHPTDYHLKITPNQALTRPDFCISNISGQSCTQNYLDEISNNLSREYSNINQNDPYFGGHITRHYHEQFPEINNIQIEIKRGIYMDESNQSLITEKVNKLKPILTTAIIDTFINNTTNS